MNKAQRNLLNYIETKLASMTQASKQVPTELENKVSHEVFKFFYQNGFTDLDGNDDDYAQELTEKLMKRLKPVLVAHQKELIANLRSYVENSFQLEGITHGHSGMKGWWLKKEDLIDFLATLEKETT